MAEDENEESPLGLTAKELDGFTMRHSSYPITLI